MREKLLCANWKMNLPEGDFDAFLRQLGPLGALRVALAPPFPFLVALAQSIRLNRDAAVTLVAQNASEHDLGAFTGEVSIPMLRQCGVGMVLVGHSERRILFGETDEAVGRKVNAALTGGVEPIVCVGEKQEARDEGRTNEVLDCQLQGAFEQLSSKPPRMIVAYEPVWAIGTGRNATPQMASEAHRFIRERFERKFPATTLTILYGGSVTPDNAAALAEEEEIDGFLVGGASLDARKLRSIGEALVGATAEKA